MTHINTHGGGAATNRNGLAFEQATETHEAMRTAGINLVQLPKRGSKLLGHEVFDKFHHRVGLQLPKGRFYKDFLEPRGVQWRNIISKKLLPDDAFINEETRTVYILEKKWQSQAGSVDEKLQGCDFKREQYEKLCNPIGFQVVYTYVANDWFQKEQYADLRDYITRKGCFLFFNEIPLEFLGLGRCL